MVYLDQTLARPEAKMQVHYKQTAQTSTSATTVAPQLTTVDSCGFLYDLIMQKEKFGHGIYGPG